MVWFHVSSQHNVLYQFHKSVCVTSAEGSSFIFRPFNNVKKSSLGYFVKVPTVGQCPTAHRYLRSPAGNGLYIGGPVSLCNHDPVGNVEVSLTSGQVMRNETMQDYHHVRVLRKSKPLTEGQEVTWNYHQVRGSGTFLQRSSWFDEVGIQQLRSSATHPLLLFCNGVQH